MKNITLPIILTANTYFWNSSSTSASRRFCEEKRQSEVLEFFNSCGLNVKRIGNKVEAAGVGIELEFYYHESCANVYKSLAVFVNGKNSNISGFKKWLRNNGFTIA